MKFRQQLNCMNKKQYYISQNENDKLKLAVTKIGPTCWIFHSLRNRVNFKS